MINQKSSLVKYACVALFILISHVMTAQLTITAGARFSLDSTIQLGLQNTDLVNDGSFSAGKSLVSISGNINSFISGSSPVHFFELGLNKSNDASLLLASDISIGSRILFSSGFLDLNGFNTDLGSTAQLDGEQESSRVVGPGGGEVLFTTTLNAPNAANPANLGAVITSGENLGNIIIRRGHKPQSANSTIAGSILRYYSITAERNANLNATFQFNYFDGELNRFDENSLQLFESTDNSNFINLGFSSRNTRQNFVEKTGIDFLARFTLSNELSPLPVHFVSFNTTCDVNNVRLSWTTAQEQNSSYFNVENSSDGIHWQVIATIAASGNSSSEKHYSFTDNNRAGDYYRLALYDLDAKVQYSSIIRSSCASREFFSVSPNPFVASVLINITAAGNSKVFLNLFDAKGALVKKTEATLFRGSNQLIMDTRNLPAGVYLMAAEWNNGQTKKTLRIVKQ